MHPFQYDTVTRYCAIKWILGIVKTFIGGIMFQVYFDELWSFLVPFIDENGSLMDPFFENVGSFLNLRPLFLLNFIHNKYSFAYKFIIYFEITLQYGCSHVNLLRHFQNTFSQTPLENCFQLWFIYSNLTIIIKL